jgi:ABC-2 type transport system permease protein
MAGIAQPQLENVGDTGLLSRFALGQYGALAVMRWRMMINSVRSVQGVFEFGARSVAFLIYSLLGIGMGFGLGLGAYIMTAHSKWQFYPILFWLVFGVWQVLPVALASFQEQFDLSLLLRFPVSFKSFFFLQLVFGLIDIPAVLGGMCCLGLGVGIILARPGEFGWTLFVLAIFAIFNILLARTVLVLIDRWLAQRRTREIVSAIFLLFMLSMQLLNPAIRQQRHRGPRKGRNHHEQQFVPPETPPWAKAVGDVLEWLPPGLAAKGLEQAEGREPVPALESLGLVGLYILASGGILSLRLRSEFSGENFNEAPTLKKTTQSDRKWLIDGRGPIAAVIEKELRTIPRSMPLLFAMGGPLLTVLVIASIMRNTVSAAGSSFLLGYPLSVSYALLGFTQIIYNNLGAEGTGIQLLFFSPTPIRKVILAKNLIHGMLYGLVALLAGIFAAFRLGVPEPEMLAATAAWLLFALPANLAAGNVLSLTMPYRLNLGRLSRQRGSQASALLSMLIQLVVMAIGGGIIVSCARIEKLWLATPILLLLAVAMVFVWMRVLSNIENLAGRNRDALIGTLAKIE